MLGGRGSYNTTIWLTQLPANNLSILDSPAIITNSAPSAIDVDLHMTIGEIGSVVAVCIIHHKSDRIIGTMKRVCIIIIIEVHLYNSIAARNQKIINDHIYQ